MATADESRAPPLGEESYPRNAGKRAHDGASHVSSDQDNTPPSTPRKRVKRSNGGESQGIMDPAGREGQGTESEVLPSSSQLGNRDTIASSLQSPSKDSGIAPTINWNVGNKTKIRTTLGSQNSIRIGGTGKREEATNQTTLGSQRDIQNAGKEDQEVARNQATLKNQSDDDNGGTKKKEVAKKRPQPQHKELLRATRRLTKLHKGLRKWPTTSHQYRELETKVHEAEVDQNYCLYYPINQDYQNLYPLTLEQGSANIGTKPWLWGLVERCMESGTLRALKAGNSIKSSLEDREGASLLPPEPVSPGHAGLVPDQGPSRSETSVPIGSLKVYSSGERVTTIDPEAAERYAIERGNAMETADFPNGDNKAFLVQIPRKPNREAEVHHSGTESEGGVMLNIQNSGQESGEISETNVQTRNGIEGRAIDVFAGEADSAETGGADMDEGAVSEDSENGDAMRNYSNSAAVANDQGFNTSHSHMIVGATIQPRTLADLSSEELKAQLRYFHISKKPQEIDRNTLIRCLLCAEEGHLAEVCDRLTCNLCGVFDEHFVQNCPQKIKCQKCREIGHDKWHCPYKLKQMSKSEIICEICVRVGHYEEDCELQWRTSGRPWESDLTKQRVRLGCYECGRSGHLGNDCPTRRPQKPMGTSTWSLNDKGQFKIKSQGEMTIKGRAQQEKSIIIDDSDDDQANFYRPRVPGPLRTGQIRIVTGTSQEALNQQPISWTPINRPPSGIVGDSRGGRYWDDLQDAQHKNRRDQGQYNYRPSDRRSTSPRYQGRASNGQIDTYQPPPLPRERLPRGGRNPARRQDGGGGADCYQPMPSAARNAWGRHRI